MPQESEKSFSKASALEVSDLGVVLGRNVILENINLTVRRGTIHALIGPNGAGKTTLIRSILGCMPHSGTIKMFFEGDGRLGYVPQFLDFDHSLPVTVSDFINLMLENRPLFLRGRKKGLEIIERILSVTECGHLTYQIMGGLSGGEFRRVLLAQALYPLPEILLLDEPESNLDEVGTAQFEQLLLKLKERYHMSILMVGHDTRRILRLADHITVVNRTVVFDGSPENLVDCREVQDLFGFCTPGVSNASTKSTDKIH